MNVTDANLYKSPRTIERETREKLQNTSNAYFVSAVRFASEQDYTHATQYLRRAIRYDKFHIRARNLLGLLMFQQGEIAEAVKEWRLSLFMRADRNRAAYYLSELGKEKQLIANMGQSLILFNEALKLAAEDQGDFALVRLKKAIQLNPRFVKAHLLLAVCYMNKQAFTAAREVLEKAKSVDPLNPDLLRYEQMVDEAIEQMDPEQTDEDIRDVSTDEEVLRTLNDPDLSNFAGEKEKTERVRDRKLVLSQFLLFVLGLVLGGLFIAYLWTPGQLRELSEEVADQNLTIAKLEQDNKNMNGLLSESRELLTTIADGGTKVSEVVLADVRALIRDIQNQIPLEGDGQ